MFNDAKLLKRYCNECGNLTSLQVTKSPPLHRMSYSHIFVTIGVSILLIILSELVKLYLK